MDRWIRSDVGVILLAVVASGVLAAWGVSAMWFVAGVLVLMAAVWPWVRN